jgi:hypothetical protein
MIEFGSMANNPSNDNEFGRRVRNALRILKLIKERRLGERYEDITDEERRQFDTIIERGDLDINRLAPAYPGAPVRAYDSADSYLLPEAEVVSDRPNLQPFSEYEDAVINTESSGNFLARTKKTGQTASGLYGMVEPTFNLVKDLIPDNSPYKNISFDDMRKDPQAQEVYGRALIFDDARIAANRGITPTAANLYMTHFLGATDFGTLMRADDNDAIEDVLPAGVIDANQEIFNPPRRRRVRTVADFKQRMRDKMGRIADMEVDIYSGQSPQALASWR